MPSSLLLLVSLLAGYLFNHILHALRFRAQTLSGHRLVFESAVTGLVFLVLARVVTYALLVGKWPATLLDHWPTITNSVSFVGTGFLSVPLGVLAATALNLAVGFKSRQLLPLPDRAPFFGRFLLARHVRRWWLSSRDASLDFTIQRFGNALHKLLHYVATQGWDRGRAVGLTMSNGKTYAAFVTTSPNLTPDDNFVSLLPLLSGHRAEKNLRVEYDYAYPLGRFSSLLKESDVVVTIPVSDIRSAHLLDEDYLESVRGEVQSSKRGR